MLEDVKNDPQTKKFLLFDQVFFQKLRFNSNIVLKLQGNL
jgi:hypothetical protein